MAKRSWTDAELADLAQEYEAKGFNEWVHICEMVCSKTGASPERVASATARRLYGTL